MTDHRIVGVQVGQPAPVTDDQGRRFESGIVKVPVDDAVLVTRTNLAGDGQADREHHGGPEMAICVYPAVHLPRWRELLGRDDLGHGAFGENLTVEGIDETTAAIGDTFAVGEVVVQVSQPRAPCWKLARRWGDKTFALEVQEAGATGWYLRVLQEGSLQVGQTARLLDRPNPTITIAEVNRGRYADTDDRELLTRLAGCDELAAEWRQAFRARLEEAQSPDGDAPPRDG